MAGILVSLEGQDAAGKSTMLVLLAEGLKRKNIPYTEVPEFSDNVLGAFIKQILKENKFIRLNVPGPSAFTETLYLLGDLYSQDEAKIKPALREGKVVIKERHADSILACQIPKIINDYPEKNEAEMWGWLERVLIQLAVPDLTFFLDVEDSILRERIIGRGEQMTESDLMIFRRRQEIYNQLAERNRKRWVILKNNEEPEEVVRQMLETILSCL